MLPRKLLQLLIALTLLILPCATFADGTFVYPFDKIATSACKWNAWSTLGDDCKMTLPRIEGANYANYKTNTLYRRVYSVLWSGTYDYGWDTGYGGHMGVDIATAEGTPVRAIGDGTVVSAGWMNGWGNTVVIKHILSDGTIIYSGYSHLSKVTAVKGAINKMERIGEVGSTGNSYGNHLHFQIDTSNSFHPFYFGSCAKGKSELSAVNGTSCQGELAANTIDPIAFIESGKIATTITKNTVEAVRDKPTVKIPQQSIKSRNEILQDEMNEFLKRTTFNIGLSEGGTNTTPGKTITSTISFTDNYNRGKAVSGNLPQMGIDFVYDRSALKVFPEKIIGLDKGARTFTVKALKAGVHTLSFKMGKGVVAERRIMALDQKEVSTPANAAIQTLGNLRITDDITVYVTMQTKYGTALIDTPYVGYWKLIASSGKVKFSNVSNLTEKNPQTERFMTEMPFSYEDTKRGILEVKLRPLGLDPIILEVVRVDGKKPVTLAKTPKASTVSLPIDLITRLPYYQENVAALKRGYFFLKQWHLFPEQSLSRAGAQSMINRVLGYEYLRVWDNDLRKKAIAAKKIEVQKKFDALGSRYDPITRAQFAEILLFAKSDPIIKNDSKVYRDESGRWKDVMTTIRTLYAFTWKDQFKSYFQPDKNITTSEALYMIMNVFK